MALNDLVKQSANPALAASQHYGRPASANPSARGAVGRVGAADKAGGPVRPSQLARLAKPGRKSDFFLADEGSEPARHKPTLDGLSAPKANASRAADKQSPPTMDAGAKTAPLPKVETPRAMELGDLPSDSKTLGALKERFDLVQVHGDGFTSLVAALLHHGASHPAHAARLAEGLRSFEEPTGEISPEAHAGFAMLKRWAQALQDGRGSEAKNDALKHPAAIAAIVLALRGIIRHMQLFGGMKRPAKDKSGHAADMEAMHTLAATCGLTLAAHSDGAQAPLATDGSVLHFLARSAPGHLDVLVPKRP